MLPEKRFNNCLGQRFHCRGREKANLERKGSVRACFYLWRRGKEGDTCRQGDVSLLGLFSWWQRNINDSNIFSLSSLLLFWRKKWNFFCAKKILFWGVWTKSGPQKEHMSQLKVTEKWMKQSSIDRSIAVASLNPGRWKEKNEGPIKRRRLRKGMKENCLRKVSRKTTESFF